MDSLGVEVSKGTTLKGHESSSTHQFSEDMFVFRGRYVEIQHGEDSIHSESLGNHVNENLKFYRK